jgi:hypothetical protein
MAAGGCSNPEPNRTARREPERRSTRLVKCPLPHQPSLACPSAIGASSGLASQTKAVTPKPVGRRRTSSRPEACSWQACLFAHQGWLRLGNRPNAPQPRLQLRHVREEDRREIERHDLREHQPADDNQAERAPGFSTRPVSHRDRALEAERGGLSPEEAICRGCLIRFRPIMMTTMAAALGAVPTGRAQATSRVLPLCTSFVHRWPPMPQELVGASPSGSKSPLPHQLDSPIDRVPTSQTAPAFPPVPRIERTALLVARAETVLPALPSRRNRA